MVKVTNKSKVTRVSSQDKRAILGARPMGRCLVLKKAIPFNLESKNVYQPITGVKKHRV